MAQEDARTETSLDETTDTPQPFDAISVEFYLYRENRDYVLGNRHKPILHDKRRGVRIKLLLAAILAVIALYSFTEFHRVYSQNAELRDHSILIAGKIVTKKSRLGQTQFGFVESSYSVTYAYIYEGKSYEGDGKVDALTYITGSRGEEIMVRVSSKHPSLARLASEEPAGLQVGWVAALTGGIAFYLIGGFLLGFLGEWRNLRKGRVVIGVAVSSSHRYEGYGKYRKFHAHIKVRLRTQTGKSITKTVESRDEALLPYLRGNQKVAIFYVDDAHWWLL